MPRPSAISKDLVFQIAYDLMEQGIHPAVNTVQSAIKTITGKAGSTKVVSGFLAQWREEVVTRRKKTPDLGFASAINESIASLTHALLEDATEQARRMVAGDSSEAQEKLAELSNALAMSQQEVEAGKAALEDANHALASSLRDLDASKTTIVAQAAQLVAAESSNARLMEEVADLKRMVDTLQEKLHAQAKDHATELGRLHTQAETQLASLRLKHDTEIQREREVWLGERSYLHKQTDEVRQASKERIDHLQSQLEGAKDMVAQYRNRASHLEQQVARWQEIAEQAQEAATRNHAGASPAHQKSKI